VAQPSHTLPIFIIKMKPEIFPKRTLLLEYEGKSSELIIENEANFAKVDYSIAAAQHHLKTSHHLQIDSSTGTFLPLSSN